jgi:hypothetical protein
MKWSWSNWQCILTTWNICISFITSAPNAMTHTLRVAMKQRLCSYLPSAHYYDTSSFYLTSLLTLLPQLRHSTHRQGVHHPFFSAHKFYHTHDANVSPPDHGTAVTAVDPSSWLTCVFAQVFGIIETMLKAQRAPWITFFLPLSSCPSTTLWIWANLCHHEDVFVKCVLLGATAVCPFYT